MNTPDDRVALSIEERRALAALEDRVGRDDPKLKVSLTSGWSYAHLHSGRVRAIAAGLCFVAGIALMLATFVQWPAIAVAGLLLQVISLRALLTRWGPPVGQGVQRRISTRHQDMT